MGADKRYLFATKEKVIRGKIQEHFFLFCLPQAAKRILHSIPNVAYKVQFWINCLLAGQNDGLIQENQLRKLWLPVYPFLLPEIVM